MGDVPSTVLRLRRDLHDPVAMPIWPAGVLLVDFTAKDAAEVHELLSLGYAQGGGVVCDFPHWRDSLLSDVDFDPALCFVARRREGPVVGVAQCWKFGFVKDLVVHPNWRRHGLGEALLLHAFAAFRQRGAAAVDLKVWENNSGAIRLYKRVGMYRV